MASTGRRQLALRHRRGSYPRFIRACLPRQAAAATAVDKGRPRAYTSGSEAGGHCAPAWVIAVNCSLVRPAWPPSRRYSRYFSYADVR
jgi:hypothetical protein